MGSIVLLLLIVLASVLVVRAGAVALEITGMDPEKARFQSLSAFTNTGFTTAESQEITRYSVRRRIVGVLIVLGYAGTVSVIATFATSLAAGDLEALALHVGILVVSLYVLYRIASWRGFTQRMRDAIGRWLVQHYDLHAPTLEEMLMVAPGIGVVRVTLPPDSRMADRPLADLGLKARKVQILSIQRSNQVFPVPGGTDTLQAGDQVLCYGDVEAARQLLSAGPVETT